MYRKTGSAKSVGELRRIFERDKSNENSSRLLEKANRCKSDPHISNAQVYKPANVDEKMLRPRKRSIDDGSGSDPQLSSVLFSNLYSEIASPRRSPLGASVESVCLSPPIGSSLEDVKEEASKTFVKEQPPNYVKKAIQKVLKKLEKESFVILTGNPGNEKSEIANKCAKQHHESCSNTILIRMKRSYRFPHMKDLKNYLIVIDGPFEYIDTKWDIECILREVQENAQKRENMCKMLLVMQRETLAFVKTYFSNMEWMRNDLVIDSSPFGNKISKEGLVDHITNMDGHCLLVLGAIAMDDGVLQCRKLHCPNQEDLMWNNVSVFAGISFQNSKTKLLCRIANALKEIYITEQSDAYVFKSEIVSESVHLSLIRINRMKYMEVCPLSKISLFSMEEMKQHSLYEIFEKRVLSEMEQETPRLTDILEMNIWQKDIVQRIGPKLVKSVLSLKEHDLGTFLQIVYKNRHIPLLSYLFIALPDLKYSKQKRTIVLDTWTAENAKHLCLCREQISQYKTGLVQSTERHIDICENLVCPSVIDFIKKEFLYYPGRYTLFSDSISPARNLKMYMSKSRENNEISKKMHSDNEFQWTILHMSSSLRRKSPYSKTLCKLLYGLVDERSEKYKRLLFTIGQELLEKWYIEIAFFQTETKVKVASIYSGLNKSTNCFLTSTIVEIVKRAFKIFHKGLNVLKVWTGTRCKKDKHTQEGIDTIVAIVRNRVIPIKDMFLGLHVIVREEHEVNREAAEVMFQASSCSGSKLIELKGSTFSSLLKSHTNITLISTSNVISSGYGKKNACIKAEPCVVIYCRVKGIVPTGEGVFPQRVDNHPVDVREGFCNFAVNPIRAGDKVTSEKREATGTLGGFVDYAESKKNAFITCAHVLYSSNELNEKLQKLSQKFIKNVSVNLNGEWQSIGRIKLATFCNSNAEEVSVDAALVDLTDFSFAADSQFSETYSVQQLRRAGIENGQIYFSSGETEILNELNSDKTLLKVGAESGLTLGKLAGKCCSNIDILNEEDSFQFPLYKQFEINSISTDKEPFLRIGDSGSFVFILNNIHTMELKCIGMAIALTSHGSCIMTPINRIFEALGLPQNCLSNFKNQSVENVTHKMLRNLTDQISAVLQGNKEMKDEIKKLSEQFTTIDEKVGNINERVNNLEKKQEEGGI